VDSKWLKLLTPWQGYSGAFLEDGSVSDNVRPTATNPEDPEKLWRLSEEIIGQKFEF
jgi:hypothetical protein